MNYLMTYESFINENYLYSPDFITIMNYINSDIAKTILACKQQYLDITEISPADGDLINYIRYGKKEQMKIGKFANKIYSLINETIPPTEMEKFVNEYKGIISAFKSMDNFDIVYGQNIRKFYNENTYSEGKGSLNQSCMRHDFCQLYLDIFVDNPDKINLLILRNPINKLKIDGRALIWNLDSDKGKKFLDFPYTTKDYMYKIFESYAKKKGWFYTLAERPPTMSWSFLLNNHYRYLETFDSQGKKVKEEFYVNLTPQEYEYYPYLDIMRYYNPDTGMLANMVDRDDDDFIILDSDHGEFRKNDGLY